MPQGFRVPEQRAERSCGLYSTGRVGTAGALAIALSMHMVDFVSIEMAGLRLMDSSMSFAQLKGVI